MAGRETVLRVTTGLLLILLSLIVLLVIISSVWPLTLHCQDDEHFVLFHAVDGGLGIRVLPASIASNFDDLVDCTTPEFTPLGTRAGDRLVPRSALLVTVLAGAALLAVLRFTRGAGRSGTSHRSRLVFARSAAMVTCVVLVALGCASALSFMWSLTVPRTEVIVGTGDWMVRTSVFLLPPPVTELRPSSPTAPMRHYGPREYVEIALPAWLLFAVACPLAVWVIVSRPRNRTGCCIACGYNLTGNVSGRCPECGTPVAGECVRKGEGQRLGTRP